MYIFIEILFYKQRLHCFGGGGNCIHIDFLQPILPIAPLLKVDLINHLQPYLLIAPLLKVDLIDLLQPYLLIAPLLKVDLIDFLQPKKGLTKA